MNQIGRDYIIFTDNLFMLSQSKNYQDLVKLLFNTIDKMDQMKTASGAQDIESKAEIDININRYRRKMHDLVTSLNDDF